MRDPQKPKGLKMFWAGLAQALGSIIASKATSNNSTLGTIKNAWNLSSKLTNSAKTTSKEV